MNEFSVNARHPKKLDLCFEEELRWITGCGQTKAYDALRVDGQFAFMLRWDPSERKLGLAVDPERKPNPRQMVINPPPGLNDPLE